MFLKFHFHTLDISPCGCFIPEKGIIFSKRVRQTSEKLKKTQCFRFVICYCKVRGTSKKLRSIQCFRFAIFYCKIFRKSGMYDIWYFLSDDKVSRQSPRDLQGQNVRTFLPLSFTKKDRFFHLGIFNVFRKIFLLIITSLPHHCVRRL